MSLLKFKRYVAIFEDENGDQIGCKVFKRRFFSSGIGQDDKRNFDYLGGTYIVDPKAKRLDLILSSQLFFDTYIYRYRINNPLPIIDKYKYDPLMRADMLRERLRSKLVKDLNSVAKGGFDINWKVLLIVSVIGIVGYLLISGQINLFPQQEEVVKSVVENVSRGGR